ncbi:site-specific DNA recombinase [Anaerovirgula multivorans]|uniref:Site-specific DNA recombinase n=1 Tax=Anaerovirgula multivorans TaxID=312168 RepID=A0A239DXR7_9FIRM|nr:recombinase family protein [Anaerovirgula multivorans]SNS36513.1 site-specific DNA recombinase [Anaerovirgula multivorans]
MKIAIYSRKSKFTGKGESIENQITLCKEYAKNHFNADEFIVYEDEGFSGGNVDRPEFKKLVKDAEKKKYDILICYRLDRISRNVSDFSNTLELLQKNNIAFVSIKEQFDTSTPMGRAMMYIASVFAQLERETIAERIRDNMMQLARTGRWLGGTYPTGFTSEPINFIDQNMKERKLYKLIPIKEELEIIKVIFEKYLELQSLQKLETFCLLNGIKTRNGNDFQKQTLKQILHNPVYATADEFIYEYLNSMDADICNDKEEFNGKFALMGYNKRDLKNTRMGRYNEKSDWIIAIGKHKGIISGKVWVKVQQLFDKNKSKAPRSGTSAAALLSGLMKCSCGSFMRVLFGPKKLNSDVRYHYYVCNKKVISKNTLCNSTRLNGGKTDDIVIEKLKKIISPTVFKSIENAKKVNKDKVKKNSLIKEKIDKNKKSIDNLVKQIAGKEDSLAAEYLMAEIEKIAKDNKGLENQLIEDNSDMDNFNLDLFKEALLEFNSKIDDSKFEEKRRLLKTIVDHIEWDGKALNIKTLKL